METKQVARRCQRLLFVRHPDKLLGGAPCMGLLDFGQHEDIFHFDIIRCSLERRVWGEGSVQVGSQAPGQVGSQAPGQVGSQVGDESEA